MTNHTDTISTSSARALETHGLSKTFGHGELTVTAVLDVDLTVAPGEVVLVDGPSGSGKTTLLLMLGALLEPTAGSVLVDGDDIWALPERRRPSLRARHFGFVFQDFNLLGALSALENVALADDDQRAVVIVTHDNRLHDIADRVLWLEDGVLKQLDTLAIDPVCHMSITPADTPHVELDGRVYWFCSTGCRDEFTATPSRFIQPDPKEL